MVSGFLWGLKIAFKNQQVKSTITLIVYSKSSISFFFFETLPYRDDWLLARVLLGNEVSISSSINWELEFGVCFDKTKFMLGLPASLLIGRLRSTTEHLKKKIRIGFSDLNTHFTLKIPKLA